jgi:hypothetical protein
MPLVHGPFYRLVSIVILAVVGKIALAQTVVPVRNTAPSSSASPAPSVPTSASVIPAKTPKVNDKPVVAPPIGDKSTMASPQPTKRLFKSNL